MTEYDNPESEKKSDNAGVDLHSQILFSMTCSFPIATAKWCTSKMSCTLVVTHTVALEMIHLRQLSHTSLDVSLSILYRDNMKQETYRGVHFSTTVQVLKIEFPFNLTILK